MAKKLRRGLIFYLRDRILYKSQDDWRIFMQRAFFLDRDGVIIEQVEYLKDPDEVKLTPGAAEALRLIHQSGFLAVVVYQASGSCITTTSTSTKRFDVFLKGLDSRR